MGKKDRCAVFGCNNDRRFPDKYVVKDLTTHADKRYISVIAAERPKGASSNIIRI